MATKKKELKVLPKLPRGMGSYRYRNTGVIQYRKQMTVDGTKINLSVDGNTVKECNQKMKEEEKRVHEQNKLKVENSRRLLQEDIYEWLTLYKQSEVVARSFDRIESTYLTHIANSSIGIMKTTDVSADDIQRFLRCVRNHKDDSDLSYSSKKKIYDLLNGFFRQKYLKEPYLNPMLTVTKPQKSNMEVEEDLVVWDDNEILAICEEAIKPLNNGIGGHKHGAAIIFIMWTFIRLGEALALQWKDVDFENEMISISKSYSRVKIRNGVRAGGYEWKICKTKNKKSRRFKMCKMAIDSLKIYRDRKNPSSADEYIFSTESGKVLSITSITNMYKSIVNQADINHAKHVTIHGLRHTGISYFLRHGVPVEIVSRMAGHQSIQITTDTYYQIIEEQKEKAVIDLNKYGNVDINQYINP